ncbi:PTS sugar transporter subunit IIA, partial [Oceanivirga salmonicida]|uniref:PTS sugar transporter subunit IIA n=1 Tax=Oceanivirga salmonicida TaxID=1769291 RepID=UPI0012E397DB
KNRYLLENIEIVSLANLDNIDYKNNDLIISTINLRNIVVNKKFNFINISPIFTLEEQKKLDKFLVPKGSNIYFDKLSEYIDENTINEKENFYIDKKNIIYINKKFKKWEEIIDYGVEIMKNLGYVSEFYKEDIKSKIYKYGSYIVVDDYIAIPHGNYEKNVYKNGCLIIYLKHSIIFPNNKEVKFLVFLSFLDKKVLEKGMIEIYNILKRIKKDTNLKNIQNKKELLNIIKGANLC